MRRELWSTAILALTLTVPVLAQVSAPGRGHGMGRTVPTTPESERAAPAPEGTRKMVPVRVTGQVESLSSQPGMGGQVMVQTAVLKTASGSVTVFLGPVWYVNEQKFPLKVGDTWEVTAHKSAMDQRPGLVAREVKTGGSVLKLRDAQSQPLWRGRGQGAEKQQ